MSDKLEKSIQELKKGRSGRHKNASAIPLAPDDAGARALSEALDSGFKIVKILILGLAVAFLYSLTFTVQPDEIAVKLRFGKPVGVGEAQILKPGLHWAFPYPIDEIVRISVGQSRTIVSSAGWFPTTPEMEIARQLPDLLFPAPRHRGVCHLFRWQCHPCQGDHEISAQPQHRVGLRIRFSSPTNLLQSILDNAIFYAATSHRRRGHLQDQIAQ